MVTQLKLLSEINRSQLLRGRKQVFNIPADWQVFYEEASETELKGFVILYTYERLTCEPDYNTGKVAEIEIYTFEKYRRQGVCTRLVTKALEYARKVGCDIVADCVPEGYKMLKKLGALDSTEQRVWFHLT